MNEYELYRKGQFMNPLVSQTLACLGIAPRLYVLPEVRNSTSECQLKRDVTVSFQAYYGIEELLLVL